MDELLNTICARALEWQLRPGWWPILPDPDDEPLVQLASESAANRKGMLARLSCDWQARWDYPVALAETFADQRGQRLQSQRLEPARSDRRLGAQRGGFLSEPRPAQTIWGRELVPNACRQLRAPQLPPDWAKIEEKAPPCCAAKAAAMHSLVEALRAQVPEFRRKESLAYRCCCP